MTKWPIVTFRSLYSESSLNGLYKSQEFHGSGVRVVNMAELFAFPFISNQEMRLLSLTYSEFKRFKLQTGDLLFARRSLIEEGAGKCVLVVEHDEPLIFESSIIRVRLDQKCNPKFYYYYFLSPVGRGAIKAIITGAAQKGIRSSELEKIEVHHPNIVTQNRIVDVLGAYDDLIENNNRRMALLEEAVHRLYKEWFVQLRFPGHEQTPIIDGLPAGWEKRPLSEVCDIVMGQSPPSEFYNDLGDGLPFHQGVTGFGARFLTHTTYCTNQNRIAEPNDILFSVRAPVGRLNITLDKIIIGRGLSALRNRQGFQSFQYYQLKTYFFKEDMIGGGAIFASVTKNQLAQQQMMIPSTNLLQEFENVARPIDQQIQNLHIQNKKLQEARDALLPRLMSGKITIHLPISLPNLQPATEHPTSVFYRSSSLTHPHKLPRVANLNKPFPKPNLSKPLSWSRFANQKQASAFRYKKKALPKNKP